MIKVPWSNQTLGVPFGNHQLFKLYLKRRECSTCAMLNTDQGQDVANKWMCWCDVTWGRATLASLCVIDLQNRYASEIAWHKGLKHVSDQKKTLKSGGDDYSTWLVLELELGYLNCLNLAGALLTTGSFAHYLGWKIVLGLFAHHQAPPSKKYVISGKDSVMMVKTLGSRILKECHCICMQDSKEADLQSYAYTNVDHVYINI